MDETFMQLALAEAEKALALGEVPVGAVIVRNGQVICAAHNQREHGKNALLHAETTAISKACERLGGWRLWECELYVTLEPCPMCAGAILNSRIRRVVYGTKDEKTGCCGSVIDLFSLPFPHRPVVEQGCCQEACTALLSRFFDALRKGKIPRFSNWTAKSEQSAAAAIPQKKQ